MPGAEAPLEVAAALILQGGRVLVARRSRRPLAGLWEFPGGKVETGETPEQALVREIQEELDLTVLPFEFLAHGLGHTAAGRPLRLWGFLCAYLGGEPQGRDHDEFLWLDPRQVLELPMPEPDHPLREALVQHMEEPSALKGSGQAPEGPAGV